MRRVQVVTAFALAVGVAGMLSRAMRRPSTDSPVEQSQSKPTIRDAATSHDTLGNAKTETFVGSRRKHPRASIDSVIIRSSDGRSHSLPVTGFASALPTEDQVRLPLADTLKKIRNALNALAAASKRGAASVAYMNLITDALEAPTKAEFHERLSKLPVTIEVTPTVDVSGNISIRRRYYVDGKLRLTLFAASKTGAAGSDGPGATELNPDQSVGPLADDGANPRDQANSTVNTVSLSPVFDYCEYTDPESSQFFSGDCATQQDLDDLAATVATVDTEVEGAQAESDAALETYCEHPDPNDSETCLLSRAPPEVSPVFHVEGDGDVPLHIDVLQRPAPCPTEPAIAAANSENSGCVGQAIAAGAGFGGWIATKYAALAIWQTPDAPVAAVGWGIFACVAAGASAGWAFADFIDCLQR
jgi:hypothetical protein